MTTDKEKAASSKETALQNSHAKYTGNNTAAQRARLLLALRKRPLSTLEIRRELDILGVAQRVLELRRRGYKIITHWREEATDCGKLHRVALYVLLGEAQSCK